jgi:hypothetical protein
MNRLAVIVATLSSFSCGPNGSHPPTDAPHDTSAGSSSLAVVAAGDFTAGDPGVLSSVQDVTYTAKLHISPGAVGDNPVTRADPAAGFVYIVNSADGDNVVQLDTATLTVQHQVNTGSGTNPQDVAVIGTKWYVATLQGSGLEVIDISQGSAAAFHFIDLGSAAAGVPACNSVFAVGTKVFVSCGLLDGNFQPTANGLVEEIDSTSDMSIATFSLQHPNPAGLFEALPDGNLAIPTMVFSNGSGSGIGSAGEGCIEKVTTSGTPASAGCIVLNSAMGPLGSYATSFAITADGKTMMMAVSAPDFVHAALMPFNLSTGSAGAALSPSSEVIGDVATCPDGDIVVTDTGSASNGLRFYAATTEKTTAPINVGINPKAAHGLVCY